MSGLMKTDIRFGQRCTRYSHNLKGAYNIKWKRTDGLNQKIVYFFIDLQRG